MSYEPLPANVKQPSALPAIASSQVPTGYDQLSFLIRSNGLKMKRSIAEFCGVRVTTSRLARSKSESFPVIIAESVTPLRLSNSADEGTFIRGKIENLRQACRRINGSVLHPGQIFSFWKQVGPPWVMRGFVRGREIREGCLIPTTGGGLCQISGALFEAASRAGLMIVERHKHSARLPGLEYVPSRDATVFWNYIDLRFKAIDETVMVEASMTPDELIVRIRSRKPLRIEPESNSDGMLMRTREASDCLSCEQTTCAQHQKTQVLLAKDSGHVKTAAMLDEFIPEFATHLNGELVDIYFLPLPAFLGGARYRWHLSAGATRRTAWITAVARALYLRFIARIANRFGRRVWVAAELRMQTSEWLARAFVRMLPHDVEHLIVAQDYLPFLWKLGAFQGRSFEVLLSRPALGVVHQRLAKAMKLMPDAPALAEYRAPEELVQAEGEALVYADRVITPHAEFAGVYPNLRRLEWQLPEVMSPADVRRPHYLLFPSSLAAREGAETAIAVAEELDLPLLVVGADREDLAASSDLVEFVSADQIPWHEVAAVVHPTLFESWPRLHLHALALEIPVVCSKFCGLEEGGLVTHVEFADDEGLRRALERSLAKEGDVFLEQHLEAIHKAENLVHDRSELRE